MLGPIFAREFLTVPRRWKHYLARSAHLGMLWIIGLTAWLAVIGWTRPATLGETARFGPLFFQILTWVQLALFLFFAALAAASSFAQEKDRRTFVLLLMTDLRNPEIVVGKLLGSLLPVALLLLGSIPILMTSILLGGVSVVQVFQATAIIAATALAAGSLGGLIALWRERTFQSLALTFLILILYFCLVWSLPLMPHWLIPVSPETLWKIRQWFDPFLAMRSAHNPLDQLTALKESGWIGQLLAGHLAPAYGFTLTMLVISILLNLIGVFMLRVWNPSGEPIMQREVPEGSEVDKDEVRAQAHAAPGTVRAVGENPILWREVATRAYGRRPLLVKLAYFLVLGLVCYAALSPLFQSEYRDPFAAAYGLLPVVVLSLLLVAAQAATAITSERDTGALDLLLVTDLTPKEFIFGKLGGIAYNTKEYLIPPMILVGVYAFLGCLATPPRSSPEAAGQMNLTAFVSLVLGIAVLQAFAMVLGIHVALRTQNSRLAVINVLSTVFFLSAGTLVCLALILISGRFEYQWTTFVFFLIAGIGGLWLVLNGERPSNALGWASTACPLAVLYTLMTILVGKPGSAESADPLLPLIFVSAAFGFAILAMLIPLVSEFDIALGRTTALGD